MQGAADPGHVLRHARENVADGRVIDKADRHLAVADGGAQKIYAEQRQQPRRELRQHGRARLRRVEIVN